MAADAAELVAAWAAAASRPSGARVASLVATLARPSSGQRPGDLTMAGWDGALLDVLAAAAPATRLDGIATCPSCGQRLDVSLAPPPPPAVGPVFAAAGPEATGPGAPAAAGPEATGPGAVAGAAGGPGATGAAAAAAPIVVAVGAGAAHGLVVTARVPTLADLDAALAAALDPPAAVAVLVDRVVVEVSDAGGPALHGEARAALLADDALLAALDTAIAEAEPAAVDPVELDCPDCGHRWSAHVALDSFAWAAAERAAGALLDDVHRLAGAYGWTHDAVLALPAPVRRHYLERVG